MLKLPAIKSLFKVDHKGPLTIRLIHSELRKWHFMYVPEKDCSEKFHQIRKVTPMMKTVLNKAADRL